MAGLLPAFGIRFLRSLVVLGIVSVLVFVILRLAPGDPALLLLGPNGTDAAMAAVRHAYGFDAGIGTQLGRFLWALLHGDLGMSLTFDQPVAGLILQALPQTALLGAAAFLLAVLLAVPAGVVCALRPGGAVDRGIGAFVALGQSMPTFWIGIMLIDVFAVTLGWLPTSGNAGPGSIILPAVTLSIYQWPLLAHTVRASMLEVLDEDYLRTARAKGLLPVRIVVVHAFRNVLTPVLTVLALQLGSILSGAVITEAVFAWPGMGTLAMSAIMSRDYPLVQGVVLVCSILVVLLNGAADGLIVLLDPRRRVRR